MRAHNKVVYDMEEDENSFIKDQNVNYLFNHDCSDFEPVI